MALAGSAARTPTAELRRLWESGERRRAIRGALEAWNELLADEGGGAETRSELWARGGAFALRRTRPAGARARANGSADRKRVTQRGSRWGAR